MYRRNSQDWKKHIDFILLDALCQQIAFVLACWLRNGFIPFSVPAYRALGVVLLLLDLVVAVAFNSMHNVRKRRYFEEGIQTLKHNLIVFGIAMIFVFAMQSGVAYSRIVIFLTFLFHGLIGYILRLIWKIVLNKKGVGSRTKSTLLVVLEADRAEETLQKLLNSHMDEYQIVGVVEKEASGRTDWLGIPVVTSLDSAAEYISREWIDAVYIDCRSTDPQISQLLADCREMGVPTMYHVRSIGQEGMKQFMEKVGGTTVITTTLNYSSTSQLFAKRCLDILGGVVGSLIALIIIAVVGPMIKKQSPGPILYTQERIGQNGKHFRIIKIRSMYPDADARKKELMEQNRIADGRMFKLDFDPRVIGNEILPDGSVKTGIGEFIRKTSLDEFPQFFNVLAGQMSLVGTRPPTVDEWETYKYHHRARLACKPGITGMWQVSGRSEITDFEEVVRLDTYYITHWGLRLDLNILLKTVGVVLKGRGAM